MLGGVLLVVLGVVRWWSWAWSHTSRPPARPQPNQPEGKPNHDQRTNTAAAVAAACCRATNSRLLYVLVILTLTVALGALALAALPLVRNPAGVWVSNIRDSGAVIRRRVTVSTPTTERGGSPVSWAPRFPSGLPLIESRAAKGVPAVNGRGAFVFAQRDRRNIFARCTGTLRGFVHSIICRSSEASPRERFFAILRKSNRKGPPSTLSKAIFP